MPDIASPPSVPDRAAFRPEAGSLRQIFLLLAAAAAAMAILLSLLPPAGHDQLWFLLMANRWLGGAHIYGPRIFDSNPPAIVWLSALPVLIGRALHLPVTLVAKSLVLLAAAAASLLSFTFLRRASSAELWGGEWAGEKVRVPAPSALLFAAIVLFGVVPARDFGQRDQILSFLILPYVLAAAVDFRQHRLVLLRCAAGVLAAAGICLKPHHALIPFAVELTLLLAPRPGATAPCRRAGAPPEPAHLRQFFRPEPILIVLLGIAYLAAIHHFTSLYFTLALPILRDTYWAIGHLSLASLALQAIELCILAAVTVALFAARPKTPSSRPERAARSGEIPAACDAGPDPELSNTGTQLSSPVIPLLLAAGFAAIIVYFLQGTGWYYQQLPALTLFGAALALELLHQLDERTQRISLKLPAWTIPATAALCILAVALTTYFTGSPFTRDRAYAPIFADPAIPDPAFFTSLPPHAPVAILTTSVEAAMMPVARFHLTWAQRTDNLWLLPATLRSEYPHPGQRPPHKIPPARLAALDALQHRWMVQDLTRWHPTLILVDRCQDPTVQCQELEDRHDNILAWFLRDPAFRTLWNHYTFTGSRGPFDAYTLRPLMP